MTVAVDVIALDHYAVADLISNLETSQIFSNIDIGPLALSQASLAQSISFHLTSTYTEKKH